jgi:hypothetical protein
MDESPNAPRFAHFARERRTWLAAVATVSLLFALLVVPAIAFDTGPHASITVDALMRAGFNRNAAIAIQVENWLTDYYTSSPTSLAPGGPAKCDLEKLHFDDLFSTADIENYWATFTANTKAAVQQAEKDDDVVEFYVVLGMSLHVVQDFYSHSNWVEQNGLTSGKYRTATWFQMSSRPPAGLYTGWYGNCLNLPPGNHVPHGGYTSGMNHDSVVRPNYDRAYVYGYAASYEWTENALDWIGSGFKNKVMNYVPSSSDAKDLAYDRKASIYVSEWIQNPLNKADLDGHWNGNRSGFTAAFARFAAGWTSAHNSLFVTKFKDTKTYAALSKNLYSGPTSQMPSFRAYPTDGTIFAMRAFSVSANSAIAGTDSYYGELTGLNVGNGEYPYRDASQYHLPRTTVPWLQLIYVPSSQSSIDFSYKLWNEWNTTNNDQVPIRRSQKTLNFTCKTIDATCTGDISGGPWTSGRPYTTSGSGTNGVRVQLYFTTTPASP